MSPPDEARGEKIRRRIGPIGPCPTAMERSGAALVPEKGNGAPVAGRRTDSRILWEEGGQRAAG